MSSSSHSNTFIYVIVPHNSDIPVYIIKTTKHDTL